MSVQLTSINCLLESVWLIFNSIMEEQYYCTAVNTTVISIAGFAATAFVALIHFLFITVIECRLIDL